MPPDLHEALTEISAIRSQMARATRFRGYGPATVAATGGLAVLAALVQAAWITAPVRDLWRYLGLWTVTAALCAVLVAIEMVLRTRRAHGELAEEMLAAALEQFVPAAVTGGLLTLMLASVSPESAWLLPALWQILIALGLFASGRFLPAPVFWVGAWYLGCGLATIALARGPLALSPVSMGIGFGVGQLLTAAILHRYREDPLGDELDA